MRITLKSFALILALVLISVGTLTQVACGPQDVAGGARAVSAASGEVKSEAANLRRSGDISEADEKRVGAIADELKQSGTNIANKAAQYESWTPEAKRELLLTSLNELTSLSDRLESEGLSPIKSEKAKSKLRGLTRGIRIGKSALAIALAALPPPRARDASPREE